MELTFDFHLHSCLSPCGSEDMTPANLAGMCAVAGYQAVALTDHNTVGNCPAFCQAAQALGLLALPGMELTCAEEVHVICLFPTLEQAQGFEKEVRRTMLPLPNQPDFFGHQILMDHQDRVLGEEEAMLAAATGISIYQVPTLVEQFGGVAYPAHIDRSSFSLLSNLGLWDPEMGFTRAELSLACPPELKARPDLAGVKFLTGCDAHYLHQIPDPTQSMTLTQATPEAVLGWLKF